MDNVKKLIEILKNWPTKEGECTYQPPSDSEQGEFTKKVYSCFPDLAEKAKHCTVPDVISLLKEACDIIDRQKAEIDRLTKENKRA